MRYQQSKRRRDNSPAMKQTPNRWDPEKAQRRPDRLQEDLADRYPHITPTREVEP